ncbi:MAG: flippase-like domain-containing protein [Gemmatimonadetes bacterium]|nr:flippase-like domain-containing protein [Gemmatimonadota bacterium]
MDARALAACLAGLSMPWALLALAISVPQVALSAYRWRLTASRLGIELPFLVAWREYYLAAFLNQVLPSGWLGDASRAWRHSRSDAEGRVGPAVRAVMIERMSGQVVMGVVAALSLASMPIAFGPAPRAWLLTVVGICAVAVTWLVIARSLRRYGRWRDDGLLASFWRDVRTALLAWDVLAVQLGTSALVVGSYLATYLVAARAVGVDTPFATLLPLVAPVLQSMLIPVSLAGWGVREVTAAGVWVAVGLSAADGVAISATYGLVVLMASLPGAVVLIISGRGRTGHPRPCTRGGTSVAARAPGSGSAAG